MRKKLIDRKDIEIANILLKDGSIPNKHLSAEVGLSPSSTLVRQKNLYRNNILYLPRAKVNPDVFLIDKYYLLVNVMTDYENQFIDWCLKDHSVLEIFDVGVERQIVVQKQFLLLVYVRRASGLNKAFVPSFFESLGVTNVNILKVSKVVKSAPVQLDFHHDVSR